jgi:hypothetical protein
MSELDGVLRGAVVGSTPLLRLWLEDDVLIEVREMLEVREAAEDVDEVDERAPPLDNDCSRSA